MEICDICVRALYFICSKKTIEKRSLGSGKRKQKKLLEFSYNSDYWSGGYTALKKMLRKTVLFYILVLFYMPC